MDRRKLLTTGLKGGIGALAFAGMPRIPGLFPEKSFDAYVRMAELARAPWSVALARSQGLLWEPRAEAAEGSEYALVTIKVLNHVFTPLVFAPGKIVDGQTQLASGIVRGSTRAGAAQAMLAAAGVDRPSDRGRYAALRLNKWFADLLHFGTKDGLAKATGNVYSGTDASIGELPEGTVALQTFLGLKQIAGQNHALKGLKIRQTLPDLALFCEEKGLVASPLGISALMMGGEYDRAEGQLSVNAVLAAQDGEAIAVPSRRIEDYVNQLRQFVSRSYVSRDPLAQNLAARFDRIVEGDPKLRRELLSSVEAFKAALGRFDTVAALESERQVFDAARGNGQSSVAGKGASHEFVAQCLYVNECLALPGKPLRNFSLFLNINDLDGKDLDAVANNPNPGQDAGGIHAFSYVEGMRQLAVGLNILGRRIAQGEKLVVCVVSEGGRGAAMEDSKSSFAMVMGPGGAGNLADALNANLTELDKPDGVVRDLAAENAQLAWNSGDGIRAKGGTRLDGAAAIPSVGDVQMGVAQFLEDKTGIDARGGVGAEDARFARLKRG